MLLPAAGGTGRSSSSGGSRCWRPDVARASTSSRRPGAHRPAAACGAGSAAPPARGGPSDSSDSRRARVARRCTGSPPALSAAAAAPHVAAAADGEAAAQPLGSDGGPQQQPSVTYLQELVLQDFGLVPSGTVCLQPGLNAISGVSGSGKSLLLAALDALLGGSPPPGCVRPPATCALLRGSWVLAAREAAAVAALLEEAGLPARARPHPGGGRLDISREIVAAPGGSGGVGRSNVQVNGVSTSLRLLRRLGALLADVNGQGAAAALRDTNQQLALLDGIAGSSSLAAELAGVVARLRGLEGALADVEALADEGERAALQKRLELVNRAGIRPGEEAALRRRLAALESRRGCLEAAASASAGLAGEPGSGRGGLSEGLAAVMGALRGVLAAEEGSARLAAAERQAQLAARRQRRRGGAQQVPGGDDGEVGVVVVGGGGAADAAGEDGESDSDDGDDGGDDEQQRDERASSSAALSALQAALEECEAAAEALAEAGEQVRRYADVARYDAGAAAALSCRLELVEKLCRRFRVRSSSELLALADGWAAQLEGFYEGAGCAEAWRAEAASLQQHATQLALTLSAARRSAAAALASSVADSLAALAMGDSRFDVQLTWQHADAAEEPRPSSHAVLAPTALEPRSPAIEQQQQDADAPGTAQATDELHALYQLSGAGLDAVTFRLAAGPSEPLRPLAATASGGEAARVMLALKAAAARAAQQQQQQQHAEVAAESSSTGSSGDGGGAFAVRAGSPPVLVLDELDAGLGSRLGEQVGRLLRQLVTGPQGVGTSQVLVVTHTPQVAAWARHHIQVVKAAGADGRVTTAFNALDRAARCDELAAMMGLPGEEGRRLGDELLAAAAAEAARGEAAAGGGSGQAANDRLLLGLSAAAAAARAARASQGLTAQS